MTGTPGAERAGAIRALEESLGEVLTAVRRLLMEKAEAVSPGMQPGTFRVLSTVQRLGPMSPSALAEAITADKGFVSRSITELEALGLLTRTQDADDRRARVVAVTELGVQRLERARAPHSGRLEHTLRDWSVDDIAHAAALLRTLAAGARDRPDGPETP